MTAPLPSPAQVDRTRLVGYSLYDFANSAFATTILAVLFNQYYAQAVAGGAEGVSILGRQVPGATIWAWLVSLSMATVVLSGPLLGALADRTGGRIRFLAAFWLPGCVLTALLATVGEGEWIRGAWIFGGAYFAFSASSIFYNALLVEVGPRESLGRVSGIAWGFGYVGGALLLVVNLLMLQAPQKLGFEEGAFTIHDCFLSVAIWWFVFTLPTLWIFRNERGSSSHPETKPAVGLGQLLQDALRDVKKTAGKISRQRNLRRFLFSYLVYNDGVQTVVAMASVFGADQLGMEASELIVYFLLIQATAFLGSSVLGWWADRWAHKPVLMVCVVSWSLLTAWGAAIGIFGNAKTEYWILGGIAGLFLGGVQTCSRSLTAQWVPEGGESEFFGFFSIMTRLAAVVGPLVYGGLVFATGSLRMAILSVTVFFIIGGWLLFGVDESKTSTERRVLETEAG